MPFAADILNRKTTRFVLWSPRPQAQLPVLVIGRLRPGNPPTVADPRRIALAAALEDGLFEIAAAKCGLDPDVVYHYWFEVDESRSTEQPPRRIAVTDPFACCVDWRVFPPDATDARQPAAVVKHVGGGQLAEADPGGESEISRPRQTAISRSWSTPAIGSGSGSSSTW